MIVKRALIIEAEGNDSQQCADLLAREGIESDVCRSGSGANEALKTPQIEDYSIVVLRWDVPGPPFGFELLLQCKRIQPHLPVIVMTGVFDLALAERATALGADDFLQKPIDGQRFRESIRRMLAGGAPDSDLLIRIRSRIIGKSLKFGNCLQEVARIIPHASARVLLQGESGTGKEVLAKAIHEYGSEAGAPWEAVNVGAIPKELVESELFGHERGAFTGATNQHIGYMERAGKGTLLLDEIGDLPEPVQVKLLRVLQEREFQRLGGKAPILFQARLICATHINLPEAIARGQFREDLFNRIAGVTIRVPPLRERKDDIELLVEHFISRNRTGRRLGLARETRTLLKEYSYPGNVRQLERILDCAAISCEGDLLLPKHLPLQEMAELINPTPYETETSSAGPWGAQWFALPYREASKQAILAFDRDYLKNVFERAERKIGKAAQLAKMDRKTFSNRWKECGLGTEPLTAEGGNG